MFHHRSMLQIARPLRCLSLAFLVVVTTTAQAHTTRDVARLPQSWADLPRTWEFEPGVVVALTLMLAMYLRGCLRLWHRLRPGRGVRWRQFWCFIIGWLALAAALVSPLHPWGSVLFSAHMVQHELLMLIVAPLMVLGRPVIAFSWSLPPGAASRLARMAKKPWVTQAGNVFSSAVMAWLVHAVMLWVWHLPLLFEATLTHESVHALQHFSFLGSALLFWWAIMDGRQKQRGYGVAVVYLFTTAMHSGLLGALLTLSNSTWYPSYTETAPTWGLTALEDQQLGGLIMWIPAGIVYVIGGLALFARWLRESEARAVALETRRALSSGS
jgi:putative membrane protein